MRKRVIAGVAVAMVLGLSVATIKPVDASAKSKITDMPNIGAHFVGNGTFINNHSKSYLATKKGKNVSISKYRYASLGVYYKLTTSKNTYYRIKAISPADDINGWVLAKNFKTGYPSLHVSSLTEAGVTAQGKIIGGPSDITVQTSTLTRNKLDPYNDFRAFVYKSESTIYWKKSSPKYAVDIVFNGEHAPSANFTNNTKHYKAYFLKSDNKTLDVKPFGSYKSFNKLNATTRSKFPAAIQINKNYNPTNIWNGALYDPATKIILLNGYGNNTYSYLPDYYLTK
ncbi:hypothetical protein AYR62_01005 [Secundilactobacillus paracollinoides]|uniref:hypothetical protein n=1 Tax=Secundilactobacillus paracollinoides TaxID=240427 RepID=UPI00081A9DEA|nr:hypothetical protein [Secundilactobacillus paracollinoides]ANZ62817.1 hypothetical protein AYR62_01005 [Secundilactobacillus paracollinoides]